MTPMIKPQKPKLEVADIFRKHISDYQNTHTLWPDQARVVSHLLNCRTPSMGGHIDRCDHCGAERIRYHSCRNRHCPKCQQVPRERWLEARKSEVLPGTYFHSVFTLPHELNPLVLRHKAVMFKMLFDAVSGTLLQFGQNHLGGKLGFVAVLHTWDQLLKAHFHLHCLIPGGALDAKGKRWIPSKGDYLFNQQALSLVFRGKFIDRLTRAIRTGKLRIDVDYQSFKSQLYRHKWVVHVLDPIKQPQHVLQYLARYTHRVAIANSRLLELKEGKVSFRYKDRKKRRFRKTTISAVEFIRRFSLHTLPQGFVRIRHYGFLATRNHTANLSFIRRLLKLPTPWRKITQSLEQMMVKLTGIDITRCPCCKKGTMLPLMELPGYRGKNPFDFIRPPNVGVRLAA
jgi:hypothetical protein